MSDPKHQKVTTYIKQPDESINITTKSYYEELTLHLEEVEKSLESSFFTLKKDVDQALLHITEDGSPKLVLTIEIKNKQPRITKRWVTLKKNFTHR